MTLIESHGYGRCKNETCNGMFGVLQRGEADFFANQIATNLVDDFKLKFIDVLGGGVEETNRIATSIDRASQNYHLDLLNTINVFSLEIYLVFMLSVLFATTLFANLARLKFSNMVNICYRYFVSQHCNILSKLAGLSFFRLFELSILITIFFYTSIGTNLISTELVSVRYPPVINTLKELYESDKKLLFIKSGLGRERFNAAKKGILKKIFEGKEKKFVKTTKFREMISMLTNENYAMEDNDRLFHVFNRLSCLMRIQLDKNTIPENNIYISSQPFSLELSSTIMRRSSAPTARELKNRLEQSLLQRTESGIIQYINRLAPRRLVTKFFGKSDLSLEVKVEKCALKNPQESQSSNNVPSIALGTILRLIYIFVTVQLLFIFVVYSEVFCRKRKTNLFIKRAHLFSSKNSSTKNNKRRHNVSNRTNK